MFSPFKISLLIVLAQKYKSFFIHDQSNFEKASDQSGLKNVDVLQSEKRESKCDDLLFKISLAAQIAVQN